MTVAEFIEDLKKMPQDAPVVQAEWEYYDGNKTYEPADAPTLDQKRSVVVVGYT